MPDVLPGSLEAQALREYANRPDGEDVPGEWFIESAEERKRLENEASSLDREDGKLNSAGRELVQAHMHLARKIVDEYDSNSPHRFDLLQEAYAALCIAADTFDPDRGQKFSTYARAVVRRKVNALKTKLRSSVSLGQEAIRFQWKHKQAERAFEREHGRRPWYGDLLSELAGRAAEEIRPIWRDRWPEDENVTGTLKAVADGDASPESRDKALTCVSVLLAGLAGAVYPDRLDEHEDHQGEQGESVPSDETRAPIDKLEVVDGEGRFPSVGSAHPRYNPGASRAGDAIVDKITREKKGQPSREQEARDLYRAKKQALWEIASLPLLLSSRQRFLMMLRLGAEGRGSRSLDEALDEIKDVPGVEVPRRDSLARTLSRAVQDIRDYVETSGAGPTGRFNPWTDPAEEEGPWHGLSLAEGSPFREDVARANQEHVLNGDGPSRWFNPYSDGAPWTSGQGRILNPWPEDPWQDAIREAMQEDPTRPDRDWPEGPSESFEPDMRTGRDPVTGGRCESAPARPVGPSRHRIEWRRIQALSRPRLGKRACQYGRLG